jgi:heme-degrading monooxygenase HmoA
MSVLVAVTDHAAERFRQRVGSRRGAVDTKPEIVERVATAYAAGRVSEEPPPGATGARGSLYVRDLKDRSVIYICRRDGAELVVVTLWETEGGVAPPRVPRRFTDALDDP